MGTRLQQQNLDVSICQCRGTPHNYASWIVQSHAKFMLVCRQYELHRHEYHAFLHTLLEQYHTRKGLVVKSQTCEQAEHRSELHRSTGVQSTPAISWPTHTLSKCFCKWVWQGFLGVDHTHVNACILF